MQTARSVTTEHASELKPGAASSRWPGERSQPSVPVRGVTSQDSAGNPSSFSKRNASSSDGSRSPEIHRLSAELEILSRAHKSVRDNPNSRSLASSRSPAVSLRALPMTETVAQRQPVVNRQPREHRTEAIATCQHVAVNFQERLTTTSCTPPTTPRSSRQRSVPSCSESIRVQHHAATRESRIFSVAR